MIGKSPQMQALQAEIDRVARSDAKVLITGESGVGQEIVKALQSPKLQAIWKEQTAQLGGETPQELAKRIREGYPKTKPVIQGDAVRVSAKSKDELQAVIAELRALDYPVALQFTNYR